MSALSSGNISKAKDIITATPYTGDLS